MSINNHHGKFWGLKPFADVMGMLIVQGDTKAILASHFSSTFSVSSSTGIPVPKIRLTLLDDQSLASMEHKFYS